MVRPIMLKGCETSETSHDTPFDLPRSLRRSPRLATVAQDKPFDSLRSLRTSRTAVVRGYNLREVSTMLRPAPGWKAAFALIALLAASVAALAQNRTAPKITTPKEQFGWDIGDDYRLVNYTQYEQYLKKVDQESDRMILLDIGKTAEGRTEYTAVITSAENQKNLGKIKEANRRLAQADGLTDEQARQLAHEGRIVVWIDGGLHATEVLGAQQLVDLVYKLTSRTDPETLRILNDVVVLCTSINPDGMELVSNWYMRNPEEKLRSTQGI